jgi:small redox-active disulfide protein 2
MIIKVEVIGPDPACARCKKTEENARKAAEKLKAEGHDIEVTKVDVMSPETMAKYGIMLTPGVAVNGVLKLQGKLPDPGVVERLIRDAI